ncbi:MAG: membrane protein insertase YidC [Gemmatimonadaceae bacterium]
MDRRLLLALLLTALVVVGTNLLFPSPRSNRSGAREDSTTVAHAPGPHAAGTAPTASPVGETALPGATAPGMAPGGTTSGTAVGPAMLAGSPAETTVVTTRVARYAFSSIGATPLSTTLISYRDNGGRGKDPVDLIRPGDQLMRYQLISGRDTLRLDTTPFQLTRTTAPSGGQTLTYGATIGGRRAEIVYNFVPDSYVVHVHGSVESTPDGTSYLLVTLPETIRSEEADTLDDQGHLSFAFKPQREGAKGIPFRKLDPGEHKLEPGPLTWVASKNKYFVVGLLAAEGGQPFSELLAVGGPRTSKVPARATGTVVIALRGGAFTLDVYAGPQEWRRLRALGRDFDTVNPYGGWLQAVVQPFATLVMRVLLWMRAELGLSYGWVLVVFGITVRLILWPLNQTAMRSSLKMQRIQPELQAAQKRHKDDPARQQQEIMRIYKEHDMSPFSTMTGCLPMLIPMPILFALFFVFQNTIEFRGVPFLWLADISLKDPFYILPVVMGATMFTLSWIGMRNAPPNPQAKMMGYFFPAMMTFFFLNFASGLNLYYAVQNLATIPQQWLIARERGRTAAAAAAGTSQKPVTQPARAT